MLVLPVRALELEIRVGSVVAVLAVRAALGSSLNA
jgi:hypothetical protein